MEARRGECSENNRILAEEALDAGLVEDGGIPREMILCQVSEHVSDHK